MREVFRVAGWDINCLGLITENTDCCGVHGRLSFAVFTGQEELPGVASSICGTVDVVTVMVVLDTV